MTNCDPDHDLAADLLQRLTDLLADETMQQRIDEPIDDAAAAFKCPQTEERSQAEFHHVIALFLAHLRAHALAGNKGPPLCGVLGEAIAMIEEGYRGTYSDGYDGALQDAIDPSYSGLELVLERMTSMLKARCREMYVLWILDRHVTSAGWEVRCALATRLIECCKEWMPPEIQRCPAEQMVDSIPELLRIHLGMNRLAKVGSSSPFGQPT
jgi:hypothetical protein